MFKECRSSGVQEFRSSGVQEFRSSLDSDPQKQVDSRFLIYSLAAKLADDL